MTDKERDNEVKKHIETHIDNFCLACTCVGTECDNCLMRKVYDVLHEED